MLITSQKSFQCKGAELSREQRSNQTHESKTDQQAKLYRTSASSEAGLSYLGHTLVENRGGLIVGAYLTQADGYAERDAASLMLYQKRKKSCKRLTVGADKGYDTRDFV